MNNITIFDKPRSKEKQMEGIAVSWAVLSGECSKCSAFSVCSADSAFQFPDNAPCMKQKRKLMEGE